ncbi:MAG: hypothetical protein ACKVP2_06095 [Burkholderiales bacterium]
MKKFLFRNTFLLLLMVFQQGAFALLYEKDIDPEHQQSHRSGETCEDCNFLGAASGSAVSSVPSLDLAAVRDAPAFRDADILVPAAMAVFDSRAPPSLS